MRLIALLFAGVLGTGCYATSSGYVAGPSVGVTATTVGPDLVYVSPGVQVIADYNEPVFYSDGFYWRETGGTWYRSHYHTHGWSYAAPPRAVISIGNRHSYRNYRPAGYRPRYNRQYNPRPSDRGYRPAAARRDYRPAPANNSYRPAPAARRDYNPAPSRPSYKPAPARKSDRRDRR